MPQYEVEFEFQKTGMSYAVKVLAETPAEALLNVLCNLRKTKDLGEGRIYLWVKGTMVETETDV